MISKSQIGFNTATFGTAEILQYNRQLFFITHELIYDVRPAHR